MSGYAQTPADILAQTIGHTSQGSTALPSPFEPQSGHYGSPVGPSQIPSPAALAGVLFGAEPWQANFETFPRQQATGGQGTILTSGVMQFTIMTMQNDTLISNLTVNVDATPASGITHGWYCFFDAGGNVRATSADQGSTTIWNTANTLVPLAVTQQASVDYSGPYYFGIMLAGSQMPSLSLSSFLGVPSSLAVMPPVLYGQIGSSLTAPFAVGSSVGSATAAVSQGFYGYVS